MGWKITNDVVKFQPRPVKIIYNKVKLGEYLEEEPVKFNPPNPIMKKFVQRLRELHYEQWGAISMALMVD